MPIPTPTADESKGEFIDRCMSNSTMREDYPDTGQRYAVCADIYERKKPKKDGKDKGKKAR
jgi:hypothetical protein